ncbi:MAG: NAD(P)/FAD-dependent oxidoreductase [Geobacteraceae bacterium]|nr:NAD(P)/FAD-dependent oxidoreductase [Geobacteraceae bacterium]
MSVEPGRYDVVIIGAGASGLMCAIEAGKRQRRVLVVDHGEQPGRKILMAGGGRCNFTNYSVDGDNFLSQNPHFCKSALSRFTQWDFLELIKRHSIRFHAREHGQLFCDESSSDILDMLLAECKTAGVEFKLRCEIDKVERREDGFQLATRQGGITATSLVVATGGLSIPAAGASPFGYRLAQQFGLPTIQTSAGLVPFTLQPEHRQQLSALSGIAVRSRVAIGAHCFCENMLFTHRGLSGPVILQISNYWQPGQRISIDLLPDVDLFTRLQEAKQQRPQKQLKSILAQWLPKRLLASRVDEALLETALRSLTDQQFFKVVEALQQWQLKPNGTEGYRTAEVTRGGVDCNAISSKTMEARQVPGLYFTGEVLDVTGA